MHATSDYVTQYIKIEEERIGEMCQISASIAVHQDGTWTVFLLSQKIPANNLVLSKFSKNIISTDILQELIFTVDEAALCPGNPEEKFVSVCKIKKDEQMSGERGFGQTIGYIDGRDSHGKKHAPVSND